MKIERQQQVRLRISEFGGIAKHPATLDKNYKYLKGIFVSIPQQIAIVGSTLGLKVGQYEVLEPIHEVRLLTSSEDVRPNDRFYNFPELIEASGQSVELNYKDGAMYPFLSDSSVNPDGVLDMNFALSASLIGLPSYLMNPANVIYPYDVRIYLLLTNKG